MRLVHIVEAGERAQMSKRSGDFISLDELLDDIGVDASRWFMLWRSHDTPSTSTSSWRGASRATTPSTTSSTPTRGSPASCAKPGGRGATPRRGRRRRRARRWSRRRSDLVKRLLEFPDEVREAAARRAPHRICAYSTAVAADFHAFYRDCQVVGAEGEGVERSRLGLCLLTKRTIAAALGLLGISAPEQM